jgi:hypothetical protein
MKFKKNIYSSTSNNSIHGRNAGIPNLLRVIMWVKNFTFKSGENLEQKLHYTTIGTPTKDKKDRSIMLC